MKKILISLLIISSFVVNAQSLLPNKYGFKVGVNISDLKSTANDGVDNINTKSVSFKSTEERVRSKIFF